MYVRARLSVRTWRHAKLLQVLCTLLRIQGKSRSKKCIEMHRNALNLHSFGRRPSCNMTSEDAHFRTRAWRLCVTKSNGPSPINLARRYRLWCGGRSWQFQCTSMLYLKAVATFYCKSWSEVLWWKDSTKISRKMRCSCFECSLLKIFQSLLSSVSS